MKRRRGNLPKAVTAILRDWLSKHKKHPYPTEEEKAALAKETSLTLNQISNWFINARRRILQPMLDQEVEMDNKDMNVLSFESSRSEGYFDRRQTRRSAEIFTHVKRRGTVRRR
ncbi:hypothetical protein DFQ30_010976 [Apophysomyces sp. BC1015]|nr:hypothetical protein DFQ30_010976 [Apophysomyces sp. BC1015]